MPEFNSSSQLGDNISGKIERSVPRSSTALNRSIEITSGGRAIGFIQSFKVNEARKMINITQHGSNEVMEVVPMEIEVQTLEVKRLMLYRSRLLDVLDDRFGGHNIQSYSETNGGRRGVLSILDYTFPFDIVVFMSRPPINSSGNLKSVQETVVSDSGVRVLAKDSEDPVIMEIYNGCWFKNIGYELTTENQIIAENATIHYTWKTGAPLSAIT